MKRLLVFLMWHTCGLLDWIPTWERDVHGRRVRCHGYFGCGLTGLSFRAARLEDRWHLYDA